MAAVLLGKVKTPGAPLITRTTAPPDADVGSSESGFWWDPSVGVPILKLRGKDSAGTGFDYAFTPLFGFAHNFDPSGGTTRVFNVASRSYYYRARGSTTAATKIGLHISVSSGNIAVATLTGLATRSSPTARTASSGSVACPIAGYAEVSLGATVNVAAPTGWLGIGCDNTTAAFYANSGNAPNVASSLALGFAAVDTTFPPPTPPVPGSGQILGGICLVAVP